MTMPVRLQSWDTNFGLAPIFEMNLPEGVLRERLRLAFAKATGSFDEFDLLTIVGRSQVGRIRYTAPDDKLDEEVPFQSVDEILASRRGGDFYRYLIERFATSSGISGVQPKVLIRDEEASAALAGHEYRVSPSYRGATHIVKFWDANDYPQLAANEYFCLKVAERCGLDVPSFRLSEGGAALVVDRFDLRPDATYRGFEDFCVLNARRTAEKYRGSYAALAVRHESKVEQPQYLFVQGALFFGHARRLVAKENRAVYEAYDGVKEWNALGNRMKGPAEAVRSLAYSDHFVWFDRLRCTGGPEELTTHMAVKDRDDVINILTKRKRELHMSLLYFFKKAYGDRKFTPRDPTTRGDRGLNTNPGSDVFGRESNTHRVDMWNNPIGDGTGLITHRERPQSKRIHRTLCCEVARGGEANV